MKHLILVGACYLDTILREANDVPFFPEEDSKLRATSLSIRRGGNCPNSLEVLQQILVQQETVGLYLITCLPSRASSATRRVIGSFGEQSLVNLDHCLYREAYDEAASSYVIRGERSSSRTIINYNDLPEMTPDEFKQKAGAFDADQETWWHFEGRIPDTTLSCIRHVRKTQPKARISVEVEKPGRSGLPELAAEADVVFYSRSWAEVRSLALCTWGADGAAALSRSTKEEEECFLCPVPKKAIAVIDPVGAGDTFIGGMLYGLVCQSQSWDVRRKVEFAVGLATRKVQQEGFGGLDAARTWG
ncbi:unnamed protein product [Clonostachys byssicola]|uniref:Carbohydrate kinase PfkB domain-containing protein n=1 Tax=Clonostachys byssicola TaxID=160290 RepID=A0A9N9UUR8_9HYPO|nr:unnamed protein product [Clonostachys byssicola]